ncbi:hypothetical protein PENTCL1PPCAC_2729, partial [Pristionchus entomophagus]
IFFSLQSLLLSNMKDDRWVDEEGNFLEVVPPLRFRDPFNVWKDPWCDLTFLMKMNIFKDMYVPDRPYDDSGMGMETYQWRQKVKWEMEEEERIREERMWRKRMEYWYPDLYPKVRQKKKKKGRTARRRILTWRRNFHKKYEEEEAERIRLEALNPMEITAAVDARAMTNPRTEYLKVDFWMMSFKDDNLDWKFAVYDKSREVFWPAESISKVTLGYELLEFMPNWSTWGSLYGLERERTCEVATTRYEVAKLRRSKSEADINKECSHWNYQMKETDQAVFEDNLDLYIQLVECESQDEEDQLRSDFYYTF